jgi:hypothetical protein
MLRMGNSLVPLIFMFDGIYLSDFSCDMKEWPVYLTISNLTSKICQMPSTHIMIMVLHLSILIKNHNIARMLLDELRQTNRDVLNMVPWRVVQPLTFEHNPSAKSRYCNILCPNGDCRCSKPVIAVWRADYPEYCDLHNHQWHVSIWCE